MKESKAINDPKPAVERIESLASRIKSGDILLPKFQRDFVWERQQILDLFDSIVNNYPIGNVLLWLSRNQLAAERSVADLDIAERPQEYPVNYLLDGQQRLSSICGALFWQGNDQTSVWNVAYDLRAERFFHLDTLADPPLHQVRLNKLPDATAFFRHVASLDTLTSEDSEVLKSRAEQLFNRFKDYQIATVTLSDMPIESVAPIFERINSTGTALTIVDLMRAATWSEEFDLIDTIDGLVLEAISEKGFGGVERKAVLRNLSAATGGGFSADSIDDLRNRSAADLKSASEAVLESYKRATDFLTHEIGAPNSEIIPYANQIVVLCEFFRKIEKPSAKQLSAIKRWFWRTTFSGYFSGWNTGQMASDLTGVREFAEGRAEELEVAAVQPGINIWRARQFRTNNAHSKMLGLMLSHNGALDLLTGQKLTLSRSLAWSNNREYHHIFPQAYLKRTGVIPKAINCLANFALLSSSSNKTIKDSSPSAYFRLCEQDLGDQFNEVIAANLISDEALDAALNNDFERFIEARSLTLQDRANTLCKWQE